LEIAIARSLEDQQHQQQDNRPFAIRGTF